MSDTDTGTAKVVDLAKDIHVSMLTTVDADGYFVSRPMGQQEVDDDGALWFFAERDSRKVAQRYEDGENEIVLLTENDSVDYATSV